MVRFAAAAPIEGLAALGENRIDGAALGKRAEVVVDGRQADARPSCAELRVQALGAAEVGAGGQKLVERALLPGRPLPLHGVS